MLKLWKIELMIMCSKEGFCCIQYSDYEGVGRSEGLVEDDEECR
jgi:hypothetical protein